MDNTGQLQLKLFQKIREVFPPDKSLVDEISDLLNITTDSAYNIRISLLSTILCPFHCLYRQANIYTGLPI